MVLTSRFWEEYQAAGIYTAHILLVNTAYIMVGYVVRDGAYGEMHGGVWWNIVRCARIRWIWWAMVGYSGIWWDMMRCGGMWSDVLGCGRIQWDLVRYMVGYGGIR